MDYISGKKIWESKTHPIVAFWYTLLFTFLLSIFGFLLFTPKSTILYITIILIAFVLSIIYGIVYWKSVSFWLTKDGLYSKKGIIFKINKFVPIYKITNFSETQGIIQQILGLSSVNIFTAGIGTRYPELLIMNIKRHKSIDLIKILTKEIRKISKLSE